MVSSYSEPSVYVKHVCFTNFTKWVDDEPKKKYSFERLGRRFDLTFLYQTYNFFFRRFNLPEPIYINVVRDPVERVISWYYYVRAPWYYVERKQIFPDLPLPDPNWLKKDFETCVLKGDRECRYLEGEIHEGIGDHRRQTLFFCGHSEKCTWVFETIRTNVIVRTGSTQRICRYKILYVLFRVTLFTLTYFQCHNNGFAI